MKSSFVASVLTAASMVSAQTTHWEDFTITLTPSSMYKHGSSSSTSSSSSSSYSPSSSSSYSPSSSSSYSPSSSSSYSPSSSSSYSPSSSSSYSPSSSSSYSPSSSSSYSPFSSSSYSPSSSSSPSSSQWSTAWTSGFSTGYTSSWGYTPSSTSFQPSSTSSSSSSYQTTSSTQPSSSPAPSSSGTPTSSGGGGSKTMDPATASTLLELQNEKRAKHQDTPPMTWSNSLSAWAYQYADSLKGTAYDPCSGTLKHSSNRHNQGENIAYATNADWTYLIDMWYDEIKDYDYNDITGIDHNGVEVGHFTQLVWASSDQVGCASVKCPNDGTYLLCEYSPEGNIYEAVSGEGEFSQFQENVKPLK